MSYLDNLFEGIQKQYKLVPSSVRILKRNIEKLNEGKVVESLDFLKDRKTIEAFLEHYKPNTQQSFINAIVKVFEAVEGESGENYQYWRAKYTELVKALQAEPSDVRTPAQQENWIEWTDVLAKQAELEAKALETRSFRDIQNALVLGLYTYFEPRRNQDYLDMLVVKRKRVSVQKLPTDSNYYLVGKNQFVFNVYKTAKTYGQQTFPIPEGIQKIFALYADVYPKKAEHLLVKEDGTPLTAVNSITRILNTIFGKKVGASMLRHSYLTHTFGDSYKQREIVASKMAHTIGTQHRYIKE